MWHEIEIIGNLGNKPEMKFTPSGQAVTSFSVAASRSYKKGEEWVKETVWFRVEAWGALAERVNTLDKGAKVFVKGRLKPDVATGGPRVYQKKDETHAANFEVNASDVKLLDKKKEAATQEEDGDPF